MNRQPRIQQLYRDLAAKMQMVRINGGTAEMFKPNCISRPRPAARAAFARYLLAEHAAVASAKWSTHRWNAGPATHGTSAREWAELMLGKPFSTRGYL